MYTRTYVFETVCGFFFICKFFFLGGRSEITRLREQSVCVCVLYLNECVCMQHQ